MTKPIYLDYQATTPVDPRVADKMLYYLTTAFGNASSVDHSYGDEADKAVKDAKRAIATLIQTSPKTLTFTSGATESINLAIQGSPSRQQTPRIALSPLEHRAVLDTCKALEQQGKVELVFLNVNSQGQLDLDHLETVLKQGVGLLCLMAANNEIGTIYPLATIGQLAQQYQVPWLCDGTQAVGKIPLNFEDWGITYLALSAHKLYGPKGIGALAVRKDYHLSPLFFGGGHQRGLRSGTLNVPGIAAFGEACRLRQQEMTSDEADIARKRDSLQKTLQANLPHLVVNGDQTARLAGNLHISLPDIPNSAIIARIRHQLALSTGAACSSGVETPSHVLRAIGLPDSLIEGSLRLSVGKFTTEADIEKAAEVLVDAVKQIEALLK
ncbi:cysteine desulfurase family protein [Spirulina sp. CS-785/01]|uniref:cysteine desulfurase family protein n=1 Tax=Spirulina sp. CS-785/01 TaxID=3021716 RepID=UPI00232D6040|nr:cysteine desulfurase family protein [Spirulina sp. CS-785/01]MDB9314642.1 cysteine desulfurase family protein [Spirulina sp. CS-785/01]